MGNTTCYGVCQMSADFLIKAFTPEVMTILEPYLQDPGPQQEAAYQVTKYFIGAFLNVSKG